MKRIVSLCIICLMMVAVIGCGGKKTNLFKTTGKITMGGKPVVGARVTLHMKGEGASRKPGGTTDDEGNVEITYPTNEGEVPGAPPGEYIVTVRKIDAAGAADPDNVDVKKAMADYEKKVKKSMSKKVSQGSGKGPEDATKGKDLVPSGYSLRPQSPLKTTVGESDDNNFSFDLDPKYKGKVINQ